MTSAHRGLREAALIFALAAGGWFLLALLSYAPADPGWSHGTGGEGVQNLAGATGAFAADALLSLFGWFAGLLPLSFLVLAVLQFRSRALIFAVERAVLGLRALGFFITLASGCLLGALSESVASPLPSGAGGILGRFLVLQSSQALGTPGLSLLGSALFLLGVTLFTGLSWFTLLARTAALLSAGAMGLRAAIQTRLDNLRDRRAAKAQAAVRRARIDQEVERRQNRRPVEIEAPKPKIEPSPRAEKEKQQKLFTLPVSGELPPLSLMDETDPKDHRALSEEALKRMADRLELKLREFGVEAAVVKVHPGPVITRFEIEPAAGVKVSRISGLAKDLARALAVISVRVVEVIPGKSTMGIEVPNEDRAVVRLREVLASSAYERAPSKLALCLGKDISGQPVVADLARMPHLLVAGTTGSGKSVGVNAMILSLLYKATPEEVRLILVDPKMLELSVYEGIPHLLTPVVTDMKDAAAALRWCVAEMERRYRLMASLGVRNMAGFNRKVSDAAKQGEPLKDPLWKRPEVVLEGDVPEAPDLETLPAIVVVIDEFADMMMIVGKKVEELIARIAQKARAAGIHLLLATQRPSVDVITGLIKANIPTRISFQVSSKVDSRTILDQGGAEQLLGHGDMLYLPPGTAVPERVHGAFVGDDEVHRVVADWKQRGTPNYLEEVLSVTADIDTLAASGGQNTGGDTEQDDPLYDEACAFVLETRRASISSVQRKLRIGYNRAARLIEAMEAAGVVSAMDAAGGREVLAPGPQGDG
ncbi:MAG: DNA translocase FtsK 4TM domain-containing protein [Pseudomonadales bacterium]|nr:DNA translocase FtsK 4TM domain-containing protein [Pseudomonadales bacterium]